MNNKVGITLIAAIALAGCGDTEAAAKATKAAPSAGGARGSEVKIGHVGPLTGGIAHLGKDNENGARLAIDEANAAKIKIGGKAVKFALVAEDDQADPEGRHHGRAEAGRRQGRRRGRPPELRHLDSGLADLQPGRHPGDLGLGHQPEAHRAGLQDPVPRRRPRRPAGPGDRELPRHQAASRKLVAVIDDATAYGEGIANEVEKTLKAAKIKVLPREKGTDKTTDWKAILTKLRGRNPDAVFYGGMDATGGPLLKQGRELGIKAVFSFGDGACTDKMKKLAGDAAEGLLCSQAGIPAAGGATRSSSTPTRRSSTPTRSSTRRSPTTRPTC